MRRRSEIDPEKYNQMVVADDDTQEHEYKNDYRGRVQNRAAELSPLPMFHLGCDQYDNAVRSYHAFAQSVERFNIAHKNARLFINCDTKQLTAFSSYIYLSRIDSLTAIVNTSKEMSLTTDIIFQRAILESVTRNFDAAITDLTICLSADSASVLALWQRAYCQLCLNEFDRSLGKEAGLKLSVVVDDLDKALSIDTDNQYLYYNRGNVHFMLKDFASASNDYTRAITIDPNLAEAYYNRGLAKISNGDRKGGVTDLSKAGELGLYGAYSVIKKVNSEKTR